MNRFKTIIKAAAVTLGLSCFAGNVNAQSISPNFFGQNTWMPDTVGNVAYNGKLHQHWGNIQNSGTTMMRFGGIAPDEHKPTNYQYTRMIDSIRANGMEPIMQVPFHKWQYTAQQAADIVQYVNITKGKNVRYWIIGNEPDLGYSYTTAGQVAAYIKQFASAMKAVDPSIKIIGPETAWYNEGIINGLTTPGGADDITGKDANGRYYIDYISFHSYPFNGSQSRAQVISKLTGAGGLKENLNKLNTRLSNCNTTHNRSGGSALKTAITEFNLAWQNASGDNVWGVGTNSFLGAQFVAEFMAVAMKQNVSFVNLWSVIEGGGNAPTNIGYLDPNNGGKKPLYYHYQMMAQHFRGQFADGTTNNGNVKAFGCKNGNEICVMIMNQDQGANLNYTVNLSTAAVSGNSPLKINIDAGVAASHSENIPSQSTVLLVFSPSGTLIQKTVYTLANHAAANIAPTVTQVAVTTGTAAPPSVGAQLEVFAIGGIYPIPAFERITVNVIKGTGHAPDEEFTVQLFNIMGQEVYNKKLTFRTGKEEIELGNLAAGEYIVRVKEGVKENFISKKIMVAR